MRKIYFIISLMLIIILSSCNQLKTYSGKPIYAMDTTITITLYNDDNADEHYKYIKGLYQKYSRLLDNFNPIANEENICSLNEKRSIAVSLDLKNVIEKALDLKEDTNGYFNPLIGSLTAKWKDAIENKEVLSSDIISQELEKINTSSIEIDDNLITIVGDANIDLGGFAKGYVTKLAIDYLNKENVKSYLINAGESTVAFGTKGDMNFKISLVGPYNNKEIKLLEMTNNSISTSSGKYQNTLIDGVRYHHLINPFTGYPANSFDNVNVIMDNSLVGDAYSTAIFAMDLESAKEFINEKNINAILYKDGKIVFER